jgi:hypothetical protein
MKKCSLLQQSLLVAFLFLFIFDIPLCSAEATSSIRWLMDQPTSLFDLGMLRLQQKNREKWTPALDAKTKSIGVLLDDLGANSVSYDQDGNIITITAAFIAPFFERVDDKFCTSILNEYKKIISPSGKELPREFDHAGYVDRSRPKDLNENISRMLMLTVRISEPKVLGGKTKSCSSKMD